MLLGCMVQGVFAQNLGIKGLVKDGRNKEPLEFANVVLQTMDSTFITGTTSCSSNKRRIHRLQNDIGKLKRFFVPTIFHQTFYP